jgi:hypothetical protein
MNRVSVRGCLFALAMLARPAVASADQELAHVAFQKTDRPPQLALIANEPHLWSD